MNKEKNCTQYKFFLQESSYMDSQNTQHISKLKKYDYRDSKSDESTLLPIKIANRAVSVYVHFDLKGAPPKVSYLEQLFPLLRKWGANGICIEYEDMFPFEGVVSDVKHKYAYTKKDIKKINQLAEENHLDVMPLLQTYGK